MSGGLDLFLLTLIAVLIFCGVPMMIFGSNTAATKLLQILRPNASTVVQDEEVHPDFLKMHPVTKSFYLMGIGVSTLFPLVIFIVTGSVEQTGLIFSVCAAIGLFFILSAFFVPAWSEEQKRWQRTITQLLSETKPESGICQITKDHNRMLQVTLFDHEKKQKTLSVVCSGLDQGDHPVIDRNFRAQIVLDKDARSAIIIGETFRLWCRELPTTHQQKHVVLIEKS